MAPDGIAADPMLLLTSDKIAVGPPQRWMLPLLCRWENDLQLSILSGDPARPCTLESVEQQYERYSKGELSNQVQFALYERPALRFIGSAGLMQIDPFHRIATYGIVIGERECWGKGFGTEATCLILDYAFTALGLHNVMLEVFSFNTRALRVYEKAGFRIIGRRRESYRLGMRTYDRVYMECLASEFQSALTPIVRL